MALQVTIPAQFVLGPPLDFPLRINSANGCFSCARNRRAVFEHDCCSDHFASVHPDGEQGMHRVHEAVDLVSTAGACVYAASGGAVISAQDDSLTVAHPGIHEGFATRYVHVTPLVERDDVVESGQTIATVNPNQDYGDHLHFGLWHWSDRDIKPLSPSTTIPIDPARLLYHWERSYELDWATIATIDESAAIDLDTGLGGTLLTGALDAAGVAYPVNPSIEILAEGCVWRIVGDDITYLLRHERGAITVFDERYGIQPLQAAEIERIGIIRRNKMPVYAVKADGRLFGIPLHDVANDQLHGAGRQEAMMADLLRQAFEQHIGVQLDLRRSPFWAMDGSLDEFLAVIEGVTLG